MQDDHARAHEALSAIPPNLPREEWHRAGRAAIAAGLNVDDLIEWSRPAGNFRSEQDVRSAFKTITPEGGTGPGTLYRIASEYGHQPKLNGDHKHQPKASNITVAPRPGQSAIDVWERCEPATWENPYIQRKNAAGVPLDGLRVLPADDPLRIGGHSMAGALVVPGFAPDGELQTLQCIPPDGPKMNLAGAPMAGASHIVGTGDGPLYVCEGIGAAWACWQATGNRAVVCFGWGNVSRVAAQLRQKEPAAVLVLVPDVGKEADADKIAREHGCMVAKLPEGWDSNSDVGDYAEREGLEALQSLLEAAAPPAPTPLPLDVVFADDLPKEFTPPDELIEGLLTTGAASVLYGDSNSGKTFAAVDMACAVARGVPWQGRRTERGIVLYLATESVGSVRARVQAYQHHHGVAVADLAIVGTPIDLFTSDASAEAIIATARQIEAAKGRPVRLIVGDTLARISAGANENSGEDMGLVVRRIDRIREATGAHVMMVHHSGKNAAQGARGWSGIRAAMDSELEVTDTPQGRCIEITKQRDLSTKGERIGFRLEPVTLGTTKWGTPATSCIVVSSDAPAKPQGKRVSEAAGAVIEFLRNQTASVRKKELVEHFHDVYDKTTIYRELKKLVDAGVVHEAAGRVAAHAQVRKGAD